MIRFFHVEKMRSPLLIKLIIFITHAEIKLECSPLADCLPIFVKSPQAFQFDFLQLYLVAIIQILE